MSTREKLRRFKSDVKSLMSSVSRATPSPRPSPEPSSMLTSSTALPSESDSKSWKNTRLLGRTLDQSTRSFGPLREAIQSTGRKEYCVLCDSLEALSEELQQHFTQRTPPAMTATIEGLCRSIKQELYYIQQKQDRGKLRRYAEAENDQEDILMCYRRIQSHLQRVTLNVDMNVWRGVDEIVADNRLKHLSPAHSARYNSSQAVELKRGSCTSGTRVDLLAQMLAWAESTISGSVYWMSGMAGTGKTTIAYSLCEELDRSDRLAASFFCSRLLPDCRDVSRIIPSISYQLARISYTFRVALLNVLEEDPDIHTSLPRMQFDALISRPLFEVKHILPDNLVVVIDALDECENKESTRQILEVLIARSSTLPVKFVISSRPEPEVRDEMRKQGDGADSRVVLHELDKYIVQTDIELYLRTALAPMGPTEDQLKTLVERAAQTSHTPSGYTAHLTRCGEYRDGKKYAEIDELYTTILRGAMSDTRLNDADIEDMRQVLDTVICAQEPLTVFMLSSLLMMDADRVRAALRPLWSVLHVSGVGELTIMLHASFTDYMLDPTRSKQYHCDSKANNRLLAQNCFRLFQEMRPQFNISGLESSYVPDEKVNGLEGRVQHAVTTELYYAARYWGNHICSATISPDLIRYLEEFLSGQLLLWMEVMNLKKCTDAIPGMIQSVKKWAVDCQVALREFLHDAWLFTTAFTSGTISISTPHIYVSMLPFWPTSSPIAKAYLGNIQGTIKTKGCPIAPQPRALLATWEFNDRVSSPTFSPDCSLVAVGVGHDVLLLSTSTGRMVLPPLKGHLDTIRSVRFSPDGSHIVSGAKDMTIRVWSTRGGEMLLEPLKRHTDTITSVAFSPDGAHVVSGSDDATINVWDPFNGTPLLGPLKDPYSVGAVSKVEYSPNGRFIISCGQGASIVVWNAQDGRALRALCSNEIMPWHYSFAISPDGTRIAAGFNAGSVCVWDFETERLILGPLVPKADVGRGVIVEVTFSPDGRYIVSGSFDGTMCVWDTTNCVMQSSFQAHTRGITSISFSPDGAYLMSGSQSKTIRLWDPWNKGSSLDPFPGHSTSVKSVGFSPDNAQILSSAQDGSICVWNVRDGDMVLGPLRQGVTIDGFSISASYSADGARVIYTTSRGLALLDAHSGNVGLRLRYDSNHWHYCPAMLSSDDTQIISATRTSYHDVVRVSSTDTGLTLMVIHPPGIRSKDDRVTLAIFSPDATLIAVLLNNDRLSLFDAHNGCLLYGPYEGQYSYHSNSIGFHPDGSHIVFGSTSEVCVQDLRSGEITLGPLRGHSGFVTSAEFSSDGTQIVSGAVDNSICVWNAQTGQLVLGPAKWHHDIVNCVRFSLDGKRVVSGSSDKTIRVTDIGTNSKNSSGLPAPVVDKWQTSTDGWVVNDQGQLLVWIPPDLRTILMWPRTVLLISKKGWFRLDLTDAHIGDSWSEIYQPL